MNYWLLKSEPDAYSIEDLRSAKRDLWDGVRNYGARNNLRAMKKGDLCFFYHSNTKSTDVGIVGLCEVIKEGYLDPEQFNVKSKYFDEKTTKDSPRWTAVDVKFVKRFKNILTLKELKADPKFKDMYITQGRGARLSVQPVAKADFQRVLKHLGETV